MQILHCRSFEISNELSANVSMYLHIPIHNVQSDLLEYGVNLFTQKDHRGE